MIQAIIVDDEKNSCELLENMLERYCPEVKVTALCNSAEDALLILREKKMELIFLDIEMPHMNGFEMLESIPDIDFSVIFTTSFDHYAIKAIRFSAMDYLLKPIDREELQHAVNKAVKASENIKPEQLNILLQKLRHPAVPVTKIALPTMEGLQLVSVDTIISCAAESNYTILLTKDKQKLTISRTLKETEEMLEDYSFQRVHNSSIVNLNEISKYIKGEGGYLIMSDGSTVDVSRGKKEALLNKLRLKRD